MDAAATVREYYDVLRRGEPLHPLFLASENTVKVGVSERLVGYDAVADALREQTATTRDWTVDSRDLVVEERDGHAWFADDVGLGWTDVDAEVRHDFETRWSGALVRTVDGWRFTTMHVSTGVDR